MIPLLLAVCLLALPAGADPEQCREAADSYHRVRGDLREAIDAYAICVAESRGRDACDAEFSDLQSAQDAFAQAVRDYEDECRR